MAEAPVIAITSATACAVPEPRLLNMPSTSSSTSLNSQTSSSGELQASLAANNVMAMICDDGGRPSLSN